MSIELFSHYTSTGLPELSFTFDAEAYYNPALEWVTDSSYRPDERVAEVWGFRTGDVEVGEAECGFDHMSYSIERNPFEGLKAH
jgi:hypothetical protein